MKNVSVLIVLLAAVLACLAYGFGPTRRAFRLTEQSPTVPVQARLALPGTSASSRGPDVLAPGLGRVPRALSLAWGGFAETAFDAWAFGKPRTLVVRFMPQFEAAFRGVLVSDGEGRCYLGMAPYAALETPAIEVAVGGVTFTSPLPDARSIDALGPKPRVPRWRHLAIASADGRVDVYLDGSKVGSLVADAKGCAGRARFGRLPRPGSVQDQFYGFIDDVALFDVALSEPEIRALSRAWQIEPNLAHLVAVWTFDEVSIDPPDSPKFLRLNGSASLTRVSKDRDGNADARVLPRPVQRTRLSLPFEKNQAWLVIQGFNSASSHHDVASFSLDFTRVSPEIQRHNPGRVPGGAPAWTFGRPILAAAAGEVTASVDCFSDDDASGCLLRAAKSRVTSLPPAKTSANRNLACVTHAPEETSCYLHLRQHSRAIRLGERVATGTRLGGAGRSGAAEVHLHFALSDRPEPNQPGEFSDLVTIPFEFSDYFASDDFGQSFRRVDAGTPIAGQWVFHGSGPTLP